MNAGLMPDAVHLTDDALDVVVSQFAVEILLIVAAQDVHVQRQQDERFARRGFQYVLGQGRDRTCSLWSRWGRPIHRSRRRGLTTPTRGGGTSSIRPRTSRRA